MEKVAFSTKLPRQPSYPHPSIEIGNYINNNSNIYALYIHSLYNLVFILRIANLFEIKLHRICHLLKCVIIIYQDIYNRVFHFLCVFSQKITYFLYKHLLLLLKIFFISIIYVRCFKFRDIWDYRHTVHELQISNFNIFSFLSITYD